MELVAHSLCSYANHVQESWANFKGFGEAGVNAWLTGKNACQAEIVKQKQQLFYALNYIDTQTPYTPHRQIRLSLSTGIMYTQCLRVFDNILQLG